MGVCWVEYRLGPQGRSLSVNRRMFVSSGLKYAMVGDACYEGKALTLSRSGSFN